MNDRALNITDAEELGGHTGKVWEGAHRGKVEHGKYHSKQK